MEQYTGLTTQFGLKSTINNTTLDGTTWTKPSGIRTVSVFVTGGGTAQEEHKGAVAILVLLVELVVLEIIIIDVSSVSLSRTVGDGGAALGIILDNHGQAGGNSSFGSYCSATGGGGGRQGNHFQIKEESGGVGSGGDINLNGGEGANGHDNHGGGTQYGSAYGK